MRPVNLLPEERRPRRDSSRPRGAYAALAVLGALLVGSIAYAITAKQVDDRQADLDSAKRQTAALEERAGALRPVSNFLAMKEQREQSVRELAAARFDWERLSRELAHLMPAGTYLTETDAQAKPAVTATGAAAATAAPTGPTLNLKGCALRQPDVATTMVRLRRLNRAEDVTLKESTKGQAGGGSGAQDCPAYSFEMTVAFSQADAPAPKGGRVPASLGGGS